ncbi:hypothetical protein PPL_10840 [Heterostelium album PN500]|uniref:Uncharacterized protein n=1 Tax=Heterostelium pallidum (strain ATCC 26659 / Pp 5 / PN500) TaxID=670386 RepID=D3BS48_HETP5|nr:hypothetical protein PPL_10840 [Heterostelium album PN500]EFA75785.1 hypothetical protein PPL_10840 [Heterostelium album PN500]|eukprot:XP_020427919.1 hypothetical protein PPL_10840 [Heterostelium album PN500]
MSLLISQLGQKTDNIDIICFSLVCKRWYNDRDKYLLFNTDRIDLLSLNNIDINQNHNHFKLPSYNNILLKSIQSKTKCKLFIGKIKYNTFDYHYDDVRNLKSIPNNVSDIYFTTNEYTEDDMEYLYRLISESQSVTKLNRCKTLKYGLPKSIKSLKYEYGVDEPLVKGLLPNSLEVLVLEDRNFKQEIPPGVLPDSLRKLYLPNYQYKIQPGVLPNGLQKFSMDGYRHEIQPGLLPSSLKSLGLTSYTSELREYLRYSFNPTTFGDSREPKSYLPISWLHAISSLSNLRSLYIFIPLSSRHDTTIFNLNYLPPTLEKLDITLQGKESILKGTMPTSLKRILLVDCQFKFDEIFPETLQYHLEIFYFINDSFIPIPPNIKIDSLSVCGETIKSTISLPSGVRSINLYMKSSGSDENNIDFCGDGVADQRCSLRELRLPTFVDGPPKVKLPKTIEYLDIGNNNLNDILHLIPSTLNTLVFENQSNNNFSIPNTIKSINNIIYRFKSYETLSIRKLDNNYYLLYSENEGRLRSQIFHQSKLEQMLKFR